MPRVPRRGRWARPSWAGLGWAGLVACCCSSLGNLEYPSCLGRMDMGFGVHDEPVSPPTFHLYIEYFLGIWVCHSSFDSGL